MITFNINSDIFLMQFKTCEYSKMMKIGYVCVSIKKQTKGTVSYKFDSQTIFKNYSITMINYVVKDINCANFILNIHFATSKEK